MPSKKKKYNARFPPARIKKIMQTDEEIGKVAAAVPVIISRALELFIESLVQRSGQVTQQKNAKTLTASHIKQTILSDEKLSFLKGLVSNISDAQPSEDDEALPTEAPVGPRPRGRPRKRKIQDADNSLMTAPAASATKGKARMKKTVETRSEDDDKTENSSDNSDTEDDDTSEDNDGTSCDMTSVKSLSSDKPSSSMSPVTPSSHFYSSSAQTAQRITSRSVSENATILPLNMSAGPTLSHSISHVEQLSIHSPMLPGFYNQRLSLPVRPSLPVTDSSSDVLPALPSDALSPAFPSTVVSSARSMPAPSAAAASMGFATHRMPPVLYLSPTISPANVYGSPRLSQVPAAPRSTLRTNSTASDLTDAR